MLLVALTGADQLRHCFTGMTQYYIIHNNIVLRGPLFFS